MQIIHYLVDLKQGGEVIGCGYRLIGMMSSGGTLQLPRIASTSLRLLIRRQNHALSRTVLYHLRIRARDWAIVFFFKLQKFPECSFHPKISWIQKSSKIHWISSKFSQKSSKKSLNFLNFLKNPQKIAQNFLNFLKIQKKSWISPYFPIFWKFPEFPLFSENFLNLGTTKLQRKKNYRLSVIIVKAHVIHFRWELANFPRRIWRSHQQSRNISQISPTKSEYQPDLTNKVGISARSHQQSRNISQISPTKSEYQPVG